MSNISSYTNLNEKNLFYEFKSQYKSSKLYKKTELSRLAIIFLTLIFFVCFLFKLQNDIVKNYILRIIAIVCIILFLFYPLKKFEIEEKNLANQIIDDIFKGIAFSPEFLKQLISLSESISFIDIEIINYFNNSIFFKSMKYIILVTFGIIVSFVTSLINNDGISKFEDNMNTIWQFSLSLGWIFLILYLVYIYYYVLRNRILNLYIEVLKDKHLTILK